MNVLILFVLMQFTNTNNPVIFDFSADKPKGEWMLINDVVMGGISSSGVEFTEEGTALFAGNVSLENYGGFASVRIKTGRLDLSNYNGIKLMVKGDGKVYKLRLRDHSGFDGVAYSVNFDTEKGKWTELSLPFSSFRPSYRGRILSSRYQLKTESVNQIGILISDKQEGPFSLEIKWVKAY